MSSTRKNRELTHIVVVAVADQVRELETAEEARLVDGAGAVEIWLLGVEGSGVVVLGVGGELVGRWEGEGEGKEGSEGEDDGEEMHFDCFVW